MLFLWNLLTALTWRLLYFYKPFRGTLRQRLGHFELGEYDPAQPGPKILVNAVSAGEVNAIAPFICELRKLRPDAQVALLTTTDSGLEMAQRKLADHVELITFFPLIDLPFASRRFLDRLRPDLYITTESELWPNMEAQCRQRGICTALVNGRVYMHNKRGWRGSLARGLLAMLDLIVCQDERQRNNFRKLGIAADKLQVSGNIKFDFELPEWDSARLAEWKKRFDVGNGRPAVVAGSTHPGEEELVLTAIKLLDPRPRLVLAPRHVERTAELKELCAAQGLVALTLAEHEAGGKPWDVLIVDRYGVLVDFYRVASVVVMGGTFHHKVGGHNVLEPTALGKPVLVGPHTFGIAAQVELLDSVGGVEHVADSADLSRKLEELLGNTARAYAIGQAAREVTAASRGAAARAARQVITLLK